MHKRQYLHDLKQGAEMHAIGTDSGGFTAIRYCVVDGIATITLNRPKQKNALDQVMREELASVVSAVRRDRGIQVLILGGAGAAFCSGGDIGTMRAASTAEEARDRMLNLHLTIEDLLTLDRPIIAAVDGPAYGAGLGLALTADLILASPRARFCLSFLRLGAIPDCGVFYTLPRIVGLQRAKELAFSTREFGPDEAKAMGIVFEIQPADSIDERARQLALSLTRLPPTALSLTKRALNASLNSSLGTMLEMEATGQGLARSTNYHREAAVRFLNKEPALFQWPPAGERHRAADE
jgi:2-(1,2-epoxy-1,2-dihydrophenyl)acetyl-CoA isomerase